MIRDHLYGLKGKQIRVYQGITCDFYEGVLGGYDDETITLLCLDDNGDVEAEFIVFLQYVTSIEYSDRRHLVAMEPILMAECD